MRQSLKIHQAAVIGGGVIGGGWAARLALHSVNVNIYDPHPETEHRCREMLANAEHAWSRLTMAPLAPQGTVCFTGSIRETVSAVQFIQECVPEDLALKKRLLGKIDESAPTDAIIASSTSGLRPTELQSEMSRPERFLVAHPFNPVYLLPLVELCAGMGTDPVTLDLASGILTELGMRPLTVRGEIDGFLADRLLEALWRESLWLIHDDAATAEEIDDAIRYGAGLRWALMGPFLTYRMAGGEEGIRHFMKQFAPALKWPWTKLMDIPEITDEFLDKISGQSDQQAEGRSIGELERIRDDGLIAIMQGLKTMDWGAGSVLKNHEKRIYERFHADQTETAPDLSKPLRLHQGQVPAEWLDYNGHMTESRYLQVFGNATDAFLGLIGLNSGYLASQRSFYTVETHIRHLNEAGVETIYHVATQLLGQDEKRLHLWHEMYRSIDRQLLATGEHMLLHVNTSAGKSCTMGSEMLGKVSRIALNHAKLPVPEAAGRSIRVLA